MPDSIKTIQILLNLLSKKWLLMKNSNSFSILIWANKAKSDVNGLIPLYARVTVMGKRAEISLKKKVNPQKWDAKTGFLKYNEVVNPLSVISEFFAIDWVYGHKKKLKKWRYFVTHDKCYCDKNHGAGSLLFTYDMNIRLLESCYLLYYGDRAADFVVTDAEAEKEKCELDWYPKNLTKKELINPVKTLKRAFKKISLHRYRDKLHEWLYAALYTKGGDDELHYKEIQKVYKMMLKVYSAVWLIYHRA